MPESSLHFQSSSEFKVEMTESETESVLKLSILFWV